MVTGDDVKRKDFRSRRLQIGHVAPFCRRFSFKCRVLRFRLLLGCAEGICALALGSSLRRIDGPATRDRWIVRDRRVQPLTYYDLSTPAISRHNPEPRTAGHTTPTPSPAQ
jgi:hypothetical protein